MSFFKDLFSSLSSNKTSEKPSQNTELLTNSAKRVIPSIADYSYRNTTKAYDLGNGSALQFPVSVIVAYHDAI